MEGVEKLICVRDGVSRLSSEASSNSKNGSPGSTPAPALTLAETGTLDFKGCILSKSHVNENNNLTNGCGSILGSLRSQASQETLSRLSLAAEHAETKETQASPADEDDVEEEEEDSRSSESKAPLSPILSAPTTIRFPAREPEKDRQQTTDSGVCRWDKCEESFESSGGLLEHLQVPRRMPFLFRSILQHFHIFPRAAAQQSNATHRMLLSDRSPSRNSSLLELTRTASRVS